LKEVIEIVEETEMDWITEINTLRAMDYSVEFKRPVLSNKIGGQSGPTIHYCALAQVFKTREITDLPIVASGGIVGAYDAKRFFGVGANAVQLGSGLLYHGGYRNNKHTGIEDFVTTAPTPALSHLFSNGRKEQMPEAFIKGFFNSKSASFKSLPIISYEIIKRFIFYIRIDIMILVILSLIDILAGISLIFPNFLVFYLGIIVTIKGASSIIGSFAMKYFFEVMGFIDLITGLMLLLGFSIPWFWILPIIKGIYSLIVGLGNR